MQSDIFHLNAPIFSLVLGSVLLSGNLVAGEYVEPAALQQQAPLSAPAYQPVAIPAATIPQRADWAGVNQRVKALGGWMFYLTEDATDSDHSGQQPEVHQHHQHHHHEHQAKDNNKPEHKGHR